MTRHEAAAALLAERARIWANVTGGKVADDDTVTIHGVTPEQIARVAKINSTLVALGYYA